MTPASGVCNQKETESLKETQRYLGMFTPMNAAVNQCRVSPDKLSNDCNLVIELLY